MFTIKICSAQEARNFWMPLWADAIVTLLDAHDMNQIPGGFPLPHLRVEMSDTLTIKNGPTKLKVAAILHFTRNLENQDCNLLVHCAAGISRSTAAAIAILCQQGRKPNNAVDHIVAIRPQAFPNELLIEHADELLGFGGKLNEAVETMQKLSVDGWRHQLYRT